MQSNQFYRIATEAAVDALKQTDVMRLQVLQQIRLLYNELAHRTARALLVLVERSTYQMLFKCSIRFTRKTATCCNTKQKRMKMIQQ